MSERELEPMRFSQYDGRGIRVHTYDDVPDYWIAYDDLHALPFETSGHRRVPFIEMMPAEAKAALRAMISDRPDLIAPLARPIDEDAGGASA